MVIGIGFTLLIIIVIICSYSLIMTAGCVLRFTNDEDSNSISVNSHYQHPAQQLTVH